MVNELVKRLSTGKHEVTIGNREEPNSEIEERLTDMKYIHVMFPNTKGGTELGINVDTESCDLTKADFNKGKGKVHIEGTTNLNYCALWFAWKKIPLGWKQVGPKGSKEECLAYIEKVWTDMRPKSLREQMEKDVTNNDEQPRVLN